MWWHVVTYVPARGDWAKCECALHLSFWSNFLNGTATLYLDVFRCFLEVGRHFLVWTHFPFKNLDLQFQLPLEKKGKTWGGRKEGVHSEYMLNEYCALSYYGKSNLSVSSGLEITANISSTSLTWLYMRCYQNHNIHHLTWWVLVKPKAS